MGESKVTLKKLFYEDGKKIVPFPLRRDVIKLVSGFFAASEIDWVRLEGKLTKKGYKIIKKPVKEEYRDRPKIYQLKRYKKTFEKQSVFVIDLEIRSLSEAEIISFIPHYVTRHNFQFVDSERVISWLNAHKGKDGFYYFVKFEINCTINIDEINGNNDKIQIKISDFLLNPIERIAEKVVYFDLRESITNQNFATKTESIIEIDEKTTNEVKTGKNIISEDMTAYSKVSTQFVSPFAYFLQKNDVKFEIIKDVDENGKPNSLQDTFNLGKILQLTIQTGELYSDAKVFLSKLVASPDDVDNSKDFKRFRLLFASKFFTFEPAFCDVDEFTDYHIKITPIVEEITAEKKNKDGYPITIKLVDTEYGVVYQPKNFCVKLTLPNIAIAIKRRSFPHKGSPVDVFVNIDGSDVDVDIPVTLKGNVGPDFVVKNPPPTDETKKSNIQKIINVKHDQAENQWNFSLDAQRSGLWLFKNQAFFKFSIGSWFYEFDQKPFWAKSIQDNKPIKSEFWKISMLVFPVWYDMLIGGLMGIYLISAAYYPALLPSLSDGLNVTTLTLPTSGIYLAYRIINWSRGLQSGSK